MMSRSSSAYRGWEHRRERDQAVEGNLPADLVPLWRKVKRELRCTTSHDCYQAMMHYAHEHPGEDVVALAEDAERDLARILGEERRAIQHETGGSIAFPPKPRKTAPKPLRGSPMARSKSRSRALARSVNVKPVVIRETRVVKQKKQRGGRRGGGGGMFGGLLGSGTTEMLMAGAALGFLDKSSFAANLPKLPFLGEHGTIAIAAYMLSGGGKNKLASNVSKGAMFLSAYELVKSGSISGDDEALGF